MIHRCRVITLKYTLIIHEQIKKLRLKINK